MIDALRKLREAESRPSFTPPEFKFVVHPNYLKESHPQHKEFQALVDCGKAIVSGPVWFTGDVGTLE